MLESLKHASSCFVTLTYDDEHLPVDGSLCPKDVQLWLKRLRRSVEPARLRYFLVGEYGNRTFRPHYHLALFGLGVEPELIGESWSKGNVVVGSLTMQSAGYVAGYVTKKMTKSDDPRLCGRYPEFARMSLRPGIGADAMDDVADVFFTKEGCDYLSDFGDVPMSLRHGSKEYPLGRYLRKKLREKLDLPELGYSAPSLVEKAKEMSLVFAHHSAATPVAKSAVLYELNKSKIRSIEVRYSIFGKKKEQI